MAPPFVPFDIPFSSTPDPDIARAMLVNCNALLKQVQQRLRDVGAECINECTLSVTECRRCLAAEAAKPVELAATKMQKARLAAYQWGMGLLAQCAEMIASVETAAQQGTNPSVHLAPPGSGNTFASNIIDPNSSILQGIQPPYPPKPNDPTKRYEVRRGKPIGSSSYVCNIHYMDSQPPPEVQWPDSVVIADNLTLQQAASVQAVCQSPSAPPGMSSVPIGRPTGGPSRTGGASASTGQGSARLNPVGPLGPPLGGPRPVGFPGLPIPVAPQPLPLPQPVPFPQPVPPLPNPPLPQPVPQPNPFPANPPLPVGQGSFVWDGSHCWGKSPILQDGWWGMELATCSGNQLVEPSVSTCLYYKAGDIPDDVTPPGDGFTWIGSGACGGVIGTGPPAEIPPTYFPPSPPIPPVVQPPHQCPTSDLYDVWHTQDGECYCIPTGNAASMPTDTLIASGVSAQACPQVIALACGDVPACRPMRQCEPQTLELASVQAWYAGIEGGSFRKDAKAYLGKAFAYSEQFTDIDAMYTASRQALADALYSGGGSLPTLEEGEYGS